MPLTRDTATLIVNVVKNDQECRSRIESIFSSLLPDSWGITGSMRNISMLYRDPSDADVARLVCVGIADASSKAISAALDGDPGMPDVESAGTIDRSLFAEHTATLVTMKDFSAFVFDWHATLDIDNPMISAKVDWLAGANAILFSDFPKKYLR